MRESCEFVQHTAAPSGRRDRAVDARPERVLMDLDLDTVDDLERDGSSCCCSAFLVGRSSAVLGTPDCGSSTRLDLYVPPASRARSPSLLSFVPAVIRWVHALSRPFVRT